MGSLTEYQISNLKANEQGSFNKVWITPDFAEIYQQGNAAYVTKARLKVMTEKDYLARQTNTSAFEIRNLKSKMFGKNGDNLKYQISNIKSAQSADAFKRHILPLIEKEVNEGKNFAPLRQIFYALTLAIWYKENLKDTIINQQYADKNKVTGIAGADQQAKEKIYNQYLQAFQKGAYDYVKNERTASKIAKRRYFSGGFEVGEGQYIRPAVALQDSNSEKVELEIKIDHSDGVPKMNMELLDQMNTGQLDVDTLVESPTRQVLGFFKEKGIKAAVYGGSVRELLLNSPDKIRDVDFLLYVEDVSPENVDTALRKAAERLGVDEDDLIKGKFKVGGVALECSGVYNREGEFFSLSARKSFFASPEIDINRIAITTEGKIISPDEALLLLKKDLVRMRGDWEKVQIVTILRGIRFFQRLKKYKVFMVGDDASKITGFFHNNISYSSCKRRQFMWSLRELKEAQFDIARLRREGAEEKIIDDRARLCMEKLAEYDLAARLDLYGETDQFIRDRENFIYMRKFSEVVENILGVNLIGWEEKKPIPALREKPALDLLRKHIVDEDFLVDISKLDFSKTVYEGQENSLDFQTLVGVLLGNIYRECDSVEEATQLLRAFDMEEYFFMIGLPLDEVEQKAREYFMRNTVEGSAQDALGGVNMTKDDFVRFSGKKAVGATGVQEQSVGIKGKVIERLCPVVLSSKPLKTVREFFTPAQSADI